MSATKGPLGKVLLNGLLPEEYQVKGDVTKSALKRNMVAFARKDPVGYARTIPHVKELGDDIATYEGISVGLDDISPQYGQRDPILKRASVSFWAAKGEKEANKVLLDTQDKLVKLTKSHPGDMGLMARSGGRGSMAQLLKATASPVVVGAYDGTPVSYMIQRGYSEGLSPAEAWIAGDESRGQVIKGQLGTADPGDIGKIMSSMMSSQVIASADCGTRNGLSMQTDDSNIIGRYVAGTSTMIGSREMQRLQKAKKSVKVRSPMTCELSQGICQKCRGSEPGGNLPDIGINVGLRSAQALSEPLTQMQLSAKHGVSLVEGAEDKPRSLVAVRQFLEVPGSFLHKATLSSVTGKVDRIAKAPQGGFEVSVGDTQHYVPPGRKLKVSTGQSLEAGDILSSGIPAPNEIVRHKGLGAGRKYLVDAFHGVYADSGNDIDKRHLETLVKSQLNHVRVGESVGGFLPGDVAPLHKVMGALEGSARTAAPRNAVGSVLARPFLHHLPGTTVTGSMAREFKDAGVGKVSVLDDVPPLEAVMHSASRTPLLNPNWMQRLGHRYQKATLLQAAHRGESADVHGYAPIPGLVIGKEFKRGPGGTY